MECIVLAKNEQTGQAAQYAIENLGESWRCLPLTRSEQALFLTQTGVDVLLLQACGESSSLLQLLTEHPLLAPPYILGMDMDGPDGRLPSPTALPGMLSDCRSEGRLPHMAFCHLSATEEMAGALLRTMAVPRRLRAWEFLPEMLALTVVHPPLLQDLRHRLYPLIARRYGMTPAGVERSLRLCVESTWTHGSLAALERFFGSSVDPERGKPTNREFLCRVQERLTLTMRRLV